MEHLTEAELQAWIDREVDADERARVRRHLEGCEACRRTAAELRSAAETFSAAMLAYDEALGAGLAAEPARRRGEAAPAHGAGRRVMRFLPAWAGRAAAVVLLLGAAAAAAMVPGSPLRDLFVGPPAEPETPAPAVAPAPAAPAGIAEGARITVSPSEGRLTVRVTGFAPGTRIVVALTDGEEAVASLPDGAPDARFVVASGRLDVVGADAPANELSGAVYVWLPRSLRLGAVELDGTMVARVTAGQLITLRQVPRTGDEAVFEAGG